MTPIDFTCTLTMNLPKALKLSPLSFALCVKNENRIGVFICLLR